MRELACARARLGVAAGALVLLGAAVALLSTSEEVTAPTTRRASVASPVRSASSVTTLAPAPAPAARTRASRAGPAAPATSAPRSQTAGLDPAPAGVEAVLPSPAQVRAALRSPSPRLRLAGLRAARELGTPELETDIELLLRTEPSLPVRAAATQVLAQGDAVGHEATLGELVRRDPDPFVQLNAIYGLARAGDEEAADWLLRACEVEQRRARAGAGRIPLHVLAAALEDPAVRSPAVVARFQALARSPAVSAATRERAAEVLRAKGV